jgi:hypothetical protein
MMHKYLMKGILPVYAFLIFRIQFSFAQSNYIVTVPDIALCQDKAVSRQMRLPIF